MTHRQPCRSSAGRGVGAAVPGLVVLAQLVPLDRQLRPGVGLARLAHEPGIATGTVIGLDEALDRHTRPIQTGLGEVEVSRQSIASTGGPGKDRAGGIGARLARQRIVDERTGHLVTEGRRRTADTLGDADSLMNGECLLSPIERPVRNRLSRAGRAEKKNDG